MLLRPVHGLIFLFKWQREAPDLAEAATVEDPEVFFAQQVVPNACATQAILSVLFNRPEISLGPELTSLKQFSWDLPPDVRGENPSSCLQQYLRALLLLNLCQHPQSCRRHDNRKL